MVACGGPSSKTAADVDDDSTSKSAGDKTPPADDAGTAAATASAGSTAGAPGSADDSTGPKKDECTVFDEPNLEGVLLKSACEAPNPTGQPPDTSKTLVVKVTASPNVVAPGGHADVLVSYTNKSAAPIPLYFTIDPMPRFEIETYNVKGNRVDLPKNSPPPLPAGVAPRWAISPWPPPVCPATAFPNKYVRGLPPYDLPLILLARLAVDKRFSGKGLGHALIAEALKITLRVADEVGCRCIITDAYPDKAGWYARYGFVPFEGTTATGPQKMFLDVRTIRRALSIESFPAERA